MSNHYRLNVRFDLDDETERRAAEYLVNLNKVDGKSHNRFIVEAVISFVERQNSKVKRYLIFDTFYGSVRELLIM